MKRRPMSLVTALYVAQAGTCCYCGKVMLVSGDMGIASFGALYGLTRRQANHRLATIEHLNRKCDGGTRERHNVALACVLCNSKRQDTNWAEYASQRANSRLYSRLKHTIREAA